MGILYSQESTREFLTSGMTTSHDNNHAALSGLLDWMELCLQQNSCLSEFGRTALTIVLEQLRQEAIKLRPDAQRVHDALQTWTSIMGEDFLTIRLQREFSKLQR